MKRKEHTMNQRMKTFGAAFCGIMLCTCMTAMSTGSVVAHAEQGSSDELAVLSAGTTDEFRGYIATSKPGTTMFNPANNMATEIVPGNYVYISEGNWVSISQYVTRKGSGAIYVSRANYAAVSGYVQKSKEALADTATWWEVYEIVPATANETDTTDNKKTDTKSSETEWSPDVSNAESLPPVPEATQDPVEPTPTDSNDPTPQEVVTNNQSAPTVESDILSLRCRESEADAKIAELEAQGYEIVRIEKLPKWWR